MYIFLNKICIWFLCLIPFGLYAPTKLANLGALPNAHDGLAMFQALLMLAACMCFADGMVALYNREVNES